jgi:hypothetical protein
MRENTTSIFVSQHASNYRTARQSIFFFSPAMLYSDVYSISYEVCIPGSSGSFFGLTVEEILVGLGADTDGEH